jgi:hypothetical protein
VAERSHTSTTEWKSFEIRMRRRRAERCFLRAEVALNAGFDEDARKALEEARRLDPWAPEIAEIEKRIALATGGQPDEPARHRWRVPLAACVGLAVAGAIGWRLAGPAEVTRTPASIRQADIILPAPTDTVAVRKTSIVAPIQTVPVVAHETAARPTQPDVTGTAGRTTTAAGSDVPRPPRVSLGAAAGLTAAPPAARRGEGLGRIDGPTVPALRTEAAPGLVPPPPAPSATATSTPAVSGIRDRADAPSAIAAIRENNSAGLSTNLDESSRVRTVLSRYEAAYSGLDASAARTVWPGVDERALVRAFGGLQSQRLSLGRCDVEVEGRSARAECTGSASWTPKVGSGRTEPRRWTFDLRNASGAWQIVKAEAR